MAVITVAIATLANTSKVELMQIAIFFADLKIRCKIYQNYPNNKGTSLSCLSVCLQICQQICPLQKIRKICLSVHKMKNLDVHTNMQSKLRPKAPSIRSPQVNFTQVSTVLTSIMDAATTIVAPISLLRPLIKRGAYSRSVIVR